MDYYVIEVKRGYEHGPWLPVNVVKSQGGRLALELAERIRMKLHPKITRTFQRVRRVQYKEYLDTATDLADRYNCQNRLDQMENLLIGCDALISI